MKQFFKSIKEVFVFILQGKLPSKVKEEINKVVKETIESFKLEQKKQFDIDLSAFQAQISKNTFLTDKVLSAPIMHTFNHEESYKKELKETLARVVKDKVLNMENTNIKVNSSQPETHIVDKKSLKDFESLIDPNYSTHKETSLAKSHKNSKKTSSAVSKKNISKDKESIKTSIKRKVAKNK